MDCSHIALYKLPSLYLPTPDVGSFFPRRILSTTCSSRKECVTASLPSVICLSSALAENGNRQSFPIEDCPNTSSTNFAEEVSSSLPYLYNNVRQSGSAHEALESLITGQKQMQLSEKELALRKSLRERRSTVKEVLIESLRALKLSATYSEKIASNMPEFIDHIMIEAAALKKKREHVNSSFAFRVRVYIEQTGLTRTIKWLKHNSFSAQRIGKLVYWVEDYEGALLPKVQWLKSINVQGRDLGVALTREPRILERSIEDLKDSVELLENSGIKREWIGWVVRRSPKILACEKEELQERVAFYSRLGIKPEDFGKMAYNFPASLGHFSLDEMCSKLEYLKDFGLDDHSLGKVIASKPQLIACSIEDGWKPLIKLLYYLGVDGYGLRRIISVEPSVFCLNLAENIAPKIRFLRAVGVHDAAIGGLIVKFPPFLSYSLDMKIRPLVRFLLETAGVPAVKVGKVLAMQPDLVAYSLHNKLEIVVKFFLFHDFQRAEIGVMVADFPMLLKYSLAILKEKFRYTKKEMGLPSKEIVKFPRLFSYSLESRIAPRHKMLVEKGLQLDLKEMLACSDEEFLNRLQAPDNTIENSETDNACHSRHVMQNSGLDAS